MKLAMSSPLVSGAGGYGYVYGGGRFGPGLGAGTGGAVFGFGNNAPMGKTKTISVNVNGSRPGVARATDVEPEMREVSLYRFLQLFAAAVFPQ